MKKLDEITIADLMPDSISGDAEVSATARAIDPQLKIISEGVDLPLILAAIDTLSVGVLEHLAAQYDLTAWDSAWPIDTKRAVLKTAIADKRKKGTRGAVQRAIEAVAPIATITEWWQTQSEMAPHTFRIDVLQDGSAVDAETQADVIAQVNDAKPVRSHFTFSVGQQAQGNMYLSGVIRTIAYARVRSSGTTLEQTAIDAGILATLRGMNIRRVIEFSHMGDMPEPTPPPAPTGIDAYTSRNKNYNKTFSNYQSAELWDDSSSYAIRDRTKYYEVQKTFTYSNGDYVENEYEYGDSRFFSVIDSGDYTHSPLAYSSLSVSYLSNNSTTTTACKFSILRDPIPFVSAATLSPDASNVTFSGTARLYDLDGNLIPYEASKNYAYVESYVQFQGSWGWWMQNIFALVNDGGYLALYSASSISVKTVIFVAGPGVHVATLTSSGGYKSCQVNKTNSGFNLYENGSTQNYDSSKAYTLHYVGDRVAGGSHVTSQQLLGQELATVGNSSGKLALLYNLSGTNNYLYNNVNYIIYSIS